MFEGACYIYSNISINRHTQNMLTALNRCKAISVLQLL